MRLTEITLGQSINTTNFDILTCYQTVLVLDLKMHETGYTDFGFSDFLLKNVKIFSK